VTVDDTILNVNSFKKSDLPKRMILQVPHIYIDAENVEELEADFLQV
jgi:hypothetical protein